MAAPRRPLITDLNGTDWVPYVPVITSQGGSTMSIGGTLSGEYIQVGYKTFLVLCSIPIILVGDSTGSLRATLPFPCASKIFTGTYFESVAGGGGFCFTLPAIGLTFFSMRKSDFTTPIVANNTVNASLLFSI